MQTVDDGAVEELMKQMTETVIVGSEGDSVVHGVMQGTVAKLEMLTEEFFMLTDEEFCKEMRRRYVANLLLIIQTASEELAEIGQSGKCPGLLNMTVLIGNSFKEDLTT